MVNDVFRLPSRENGIQLIDTKMKPTQGKNLMINKKFLGEEEEKVHHVNIPINIPIKIRGFK